MRKWAEDLNRNFSNEDTLMASRHMKTLNIAHIRETQIRTTVRGHFTLVRMVIIKKSTKNKRWREFGEKGALPHCWWECELVQPRWRIARRFLKKLKIELPYDPEIPFLGFYLEKIRSKGIHVPQCSLKIPGVTGKFGLGVQNEAGQRLTEFCQGNTLVIANTLFQQPKR